MRGGDSVLVHDQQRPDLRLRMVEMEQTLLGTNDVVLAMPADVRLRAFRVACRTARW